jgi:hypothetical protein
MGQRQSRVHRRSALRTAKPSLSLQPRSCTPLSSRPTTPGAREVLRRLRICAQIRRRVPRSRLRPARCSPAPRRRRRIRRCPPPGRSRMRAHRGRRCRGRVCGRGARRGLRSPAGSCRSSTCLPAANGAARYRRLVYARACARKSLRACAPGPAGRATPIRRRPRRRTPPRRRRPATSRPAIAATAAASRRRFERSTGVIVPGGGALHRPRCPTASPPPCQAAGDAHCSRLGCVTRSFGWALGRPA